MWNIFINWRSGKLLCKKNPHRHFSKLKSLWKKMLHIIKSRTHTKLSKLSP